MKTDLDPDAVSCFGYCVQCDQTHSLPFGNALQYARDLMVEFQTIQRLDYLVPKSDANPNYHFNKLLPGDRGHMFGVLECFDPNTRTTKWLRAYSSLSSGVRQIDGWVPYLISEEQFESLILPVQLEIKNLTQQRNELPKGSPNRELIESQRAALSRELMPKIHDLYQFTNFRGETKPIHDFFPVGRIPGGVGDCCAPKLLNAAIKQGLKPVSLAEFFWGGSNQSGRKQPGDFFPACTDKCQPILGFMLCGA